MPPENDGNLLLSRGSLGNFQNLNSPGLLKRSLIARAKPAQLLRNPKTPVVGDPSYRQTSIDKTNDCVMKSERGTLVGGSDPP